MAGSMMEKTGSFFNPYIFYDADDLPLGIIYITTR